jgi:hypothetical protein
MSIGQSHMLQISMLSCRRQYRSVQTQAKNHALIHSATQDVFSQDTCDCLKCASIGCYLHLKFGYGLAMTGKSILEPPTNK